MTVLDRVHVFLPTHGKCGNGSESRVISGIEFGAIDPTLTGMYQQCSACWRTVWVDSFNIKRKG